MKEREELVREIGESLDFVKSKTPEPTPNALWQGPMSESRLNITSDLSRCSEPDAIGGMRLHLTHGMGFFAPNASKETSKGWARP